VEPNVEYGTARLKSVAELGHTNTLGALVVGDNWVVMAIAHADPMGQIVPIRQRCRFFEAAPGEDPSLAAVSDAVVQCWTALGGDHELIYSRFALSLPPRATVSRQARCRISTLPRGPFRSDRATVTPAHVRDTATRIARDGFWPKLVACDVVPLAYWTDGDHRVPDPVGRHSETLTFDAHLILADQDMARTVLDALRTQDIRVDFMTSAFASAAGNLAPAERTRDTLLIEVDRLTTTCTGFDEGEIVFADWIEGGSYQVLSGAAERLQTEPENLAHWLNEREAMGLTELPAASGLLPLCPAWGHAPANLVDLDHAARKAAAGIATQVGTLVHGLLAKHQRPPRHLILTGDDNLSLRALTLLLQQKGHCCEWRPARDRHTWDRPDVRTPGVSRMSGLLRAAARRGARHQPFLDDYNEAAVNRIGRSLLAVHERAGSWWTARRPGTPPARPTSFAANPQPRPRLATVLNQLLW
jgi:hypothetical protein